MQADGTITYPILGTSYKVPAYGMYTNNSYSGCGEPIDIEASYATGLNGEVCGVIFNSITSNKFTINGASYKAATKIWFFEANGEYQIGVLSD